MSLFGAMISGVSGLNAQSQNLGVISDNISNMNTIGYKRTLGRFSTLVTESATPTRYTPGGVRFHPTAMISKQGLLQSSSSATSAAISGDGFFVVRDTATPNANDEVFFTRAGDFRPDDDGYLKNTAGFFVQGWATDRDGNLLDQLGNTTSSNSAAVGDLQVIDVNRILRASADTRNISIGGNLDADETPFAGGTDTSTTLGINGTTALAGQAGIAAGDSFDITVNGNTTTITITGTDTLNDIAAKISAIPGVNASATSTGTDDTLTITGPGDQNVTVTNNNNTPLTALGFAGPFPATLAATYTPGSIAAGTVDENTTMPITVYDSLGSAHTVNLRFLKVSQNRWAFELTGQTTAGNLDPSAHPNGLIQSGYLNFDGDGVISSFTDSTGASLIDQPLSITYTNGSNASEITLDLGNPGVGNGITQKGGGVDANGNLVSYSTDFINQDGAGAGSQVGYGFSSDGFLEVQFANGVKRPMFKLAIATFEAPDELGAESGNVYRQTRDSGDYVLREPGIDGAGKVVASALEGSNVDLAEEFTNMIVTQRAYSANTKTITTTDEMLDELIRVKR
ncbi:flagellar hook protein FlgE [Thalassospira xiamenensis M-5 = DSM 17429]|uniref:Flagellar hook protein FlgE n=2 Tax=Thalassospira xiamenensis TaxID=220697 RepID=A0AB72U9S8_9PROT|nr:Flagellar hook protein flgE [Thalassospira xiamenensis M-5 = DSM 17429]SIT29788.1 flagellar hook protein FlgE [Thalassospira xiamenensis M-5 = DSM 17429]